MDLGHEATTLFGTSTPDCSNATAPQFLPVVFWFFTYNPSAKASATMCSPTIALVDAQVTVDIASQNVTHVHELGPFNAATSKFGSLSANLTGPPLNGHAYNGINFTLASPDAFIEARMNATQLVMPAAVFQAAVQSVQGVQGSFDADLFVELANTVYATYLALIAKAVYFLQNEEPVTLQLNFPAAVVDELSGGAPPCCGILPTRNCSVSHPRLPSLGAAEPVPAAPARDDRVGGVDRCGDRNGTPGCKTA